jgi:phospholipid/cholesterol/gamma-HCH transport system permease protein
MSWVTDELERGHIGERQRHPPKGALMEAVQGAADTQSEMHLSRPDSDMVLLHLSGNWRLQRTLPSVAEVQRQLEAGPPVQRLGFDTQQLTRWDSGLVTFLCGIVDLCTRHHITPDQTGLPDGVRRLLALATAVPERQGARRDAGRDPMLARIGKAALTTTASAGAMLAFIGEAFLAFLKMLRG